ncbi:MAG: hypothetical protein RLO81_09705 [Fulvivirga sp.]|uniref:hypothetical protein n=1 Tax=Fulvivirga sp. TaxID=1931237 RepID=UPI0032ECD32E
MYKNIILLLLIYTSTFQDLFSQDPTSLIIVSNSNSKVIVDGEKIGEVQKGKPEKFTITSGEHYLQVICLCPSGYEKNEILSLEPNTQKVIKIEFESAQSSNLSEKVVAQFDFSIPGIMTSDGSDQPTVYYAFERGDEVVLNLSMSNDKGTNQLQVFTYPEQKIIFTKDNFQDLKNTRFNVGSRGIYGISFSTNHAFDRNVSLKISRIPASEETIEFNCEVELEDVYTPYVIQQPQNFYLNGGSKATFGDGKSRTYLPINLPEGTVKWYYEFTAERSDVENDNTKNMLTLASDLSRLVDQTGALSFGIDQLSQPPGSDYCDIYLIDHSNLNPFLTKQPFTYYTVASRENFKSGIMEVDFQPNEQIYLGIKNPSTFYGINVGIEVVAIVKSQELVMINN